MSRDLIAQAVKRLFAAISTPAPPVVKVRREDLEMLLSCWKETKDVD